MKLLITLLSAVLASASAAIFKNDGCPPLFENVGGRCYFFSTLLDEYRDFYASRQFCLDLGDSIGDVQLAKFDDDYVDYKNIVEYMQDNNVDKFWVGATDENNEGAWKWADGTDVDLNSPLWRCTDPKDSAGYNCAALEKEFVSVNNVNYDRFRLMNLECAASLHFICQFRNETLMW